MIYVSFRFTASFRVRVQYRVRVSLSGWFLKFSYYT